MKQKLPPAHLKCLSFSCVTRRPLAASRFSSQAWPCVCVSAGESVGVGKLVREGGGRWR
jgi:hypothetical protein